MINCYDSYVDTNVKKAQVVYLRAEKDLDWHDIADIVGYAVSTVKSYYYKFKGFLQSVKDYFEGKINELVNLVYKKTQTARKNVVYECEQIADNVPTAYVTEVSDCGEHKFIKIGFSNQVLTRMNEHATNKKYGSDLTVYVKAIYVFDDEEDAKIMECKLRKYFKNRNNGADYVKQDRFVEQRIDNDILKELSNIAKLLK